MIWRDCVQEAEDPLVVLRELPVTRVLNTTCGPNRKETGTRNREIEWVTGRFKRPLSQIGGPLLQGDAGFDGVELHYAHAYTMASFLSPLNTRADGYGGAVAQRARLALEVYQRVRGRVGADFPVGCRFLAEECIEGGGTVSDAEYFARVFAEAGMDFLSLSRGGKFDDAQQPKVGAAAYPYTGRSGYECMPSYYSDAQGPFGRNLGATARIRAAVRAANRTTPLITSLCGGVDLGRAGGAGVWHTGGAGAKPEPGNRYIARARNAHDSE